MAKKEPESLAETIGTYTGLTILGAGALGFVYFAFVNGAFSYHPPNDEMYDWELLEEMNNSPSDNMYEKEYHNVDGYYRSDGTYVAPHTRSNPDFSEYNNLNP